MKERHDAGGVDRNASTADSTSSTPSGDVPMSAEEARAWFENVRRQNEEADAASDNKPSKIMGLVGGLILAACLGGTIRGLILGMPWWGSLIIIGSGLLFCLLFVLPVWILFGTPWRPKQT